ncbi:MAG TPA: hypothetical protein VF629_01505 [Hymenobacter sp.]|jgi:hypothetical protein|uniref:hypothetical protein n=1 Tax=Hymenobacter sp. TaxID=1898978 RepID=UPI002ED9F10B
MKNIIPHLLVALVLSSGIASSAAAQKRPKSSAKRAFSHNSESSKGKTSKARFRRENDRPVIDLNPNSLVKTKTTKAPKPYKFSNGNGFKPVK